MQIHLSVNHLVIHGEECKSSAFSLRSTQHFSPLNYTLISSIRDGRKMKLLISNFINFLIFAGTHIE